MKIAIFGATGLLGSNLVKLYINKKYQLKTFNRNDFDNLENIVEKKFNNWSPDIIINAIALVNLQTCEDDYGLAYKSNVETAIQIANIAKKYKSYFIHISTDHLFNDDKIYHTEEDKISILNNYAKTKYKAEEEVLAFYSNTLVVRTNIIGFRNNERDSFFEWLLTSLKSEKKISLYSNFYTSPIDILSLGTLLLKCFENRLLGIYNISSSQIINKYNFGMKVAKQFNFSVKNIQKSIITTDINSDVKRALTLGLDVSKIENALNTKMPSVDESIKTLYREYMERK